MYMFSDVMITIIENYRKVFLFKFLLDFTTIETHSRGLAELIPEYLRIRLTIQVYRKKARDSPSLKHIWGGL